MTEQEFKSVLVKTEDIPLLNIKLRENYKKNKKRWEKYKKEFNKKVDEENKKSLTEKRTYIKIEEEIKNLLNSNYKKDIGSKFKSLLLELKTSYGITPTTKFLRNLVIGGNKQKSNRVKYLLEKAELKTKTTVKCFKEWIFQKWDSEVIIYKNNLKKKVYNEEVNFNGDITREEINLLKKEGYTKEELILMSDDCKKEIIQQLKQNLRNAININGKPFIKDVKKLRIGRCFIGNTTKVFNVIQI